MENAEIVSPSLILQPPADYNCKDFLNHAFFDEEVENTAGPSDKAGISKENPPANKKPRLSLSLKKHKEKVNLNSDSVLKDMNSSTVNVSGCYGRQAGRQIYLNFEIKICQT